MSGLDKRWELSDQGWEEQFSQEGFAFIRGAVDPETCAQAMDRVRQIVPGLPDDPRTWESPTVPTLHAPYFGEVGQSDPGLDKVIDAPGLQHAIERLHGGPGRYNGHKNYYLFLRPFDPKAKQALAPAGHIDFGGQPIPALYRGFVVQLMLHDSEPFAGNLTLYPGTHKQVQKLVMDNSSVQFKSGLVPDLAQPAPVEFVGQAGDICLMHHLLIHSGNASHATGRTPRVAMMIEAFSSQWLESIDPATPGLSGWERSLAHNGPYREHPDTLAANKARRAEYYEKITKKPDA